MSTCVTTAAPFRVAGSPTLTDTYLQMTDVVLSMALPDWNTHRAFMTERTRTFASAPHLGIAGSYRFYAQASADNVEKLDLQITVGLAPSFLFGAND